MIISLLWFFVVLFCLGFPLSAGLFRKDFSETFIGSLLLGLPVMVVLLLIFPLRNPYYFGIVAIMWCGFSFRKFKSVKWVLNKNVLYNFGAVIIAILVMVLMFYGSQAYPWLEDDDPWDHAAAAKYVSKTGSASKTLEQYDLYGRLYMEPYPPSYPALMGVIHQLNDSIQTTLKLFNAVLIGLATLFFYFMAKLLVNKNKAFLATFLLAALPSFMSHFIWSQTLAIALMFPALYCLLKLSEQRKSFAWFLLTILFSASVLITQPSSAAIFGIMFILVWVSKIVAEWYKNKKLDLQMSMFMAGVFAIIFSFMIFWGPTLLKFGYSETLAGIGLEPALFTDKTHDTSGGLVYGLKDFLVVPLASKIDQATGWGLFIFLGVVAGTIFLIKTFKKKPFLSLTVLSWFAFTLLFLEGNALPFKLFPHRFWAFLAIPAVLLASIGIIELAKIVPSKKWKTGLFALFIIGVLLTSLWPKIIVQTSQWPFGGNFASIEEMQGYLWMQDNLPKNTRVLNLCGPEEKVIGFDMDADILNVDQYYFKNSIVNKTATEIKQFAKNNNYAYITVDTKCLQIIGMNQTDQLLQKIGTTNPLTHNTGGFWLFKNV